MPAHMKRALHIVVQTIRQIDRHLPVLLFAMLLSVQGLLAAGAADSIVFPELRGPDGRVLSFADLCNTVGEDGDAADHCGTCALHKAGHLPAPTTVSYTALLTSQTGLRPHGRVLPSTPERWQYYRRGPPLTA
jgi:hypothetical protein